MFSLWVPSRLTSSFQLWSMDEGREGTAEGTQLQLCARCPDPGPEIASSKFILIWALIPESGAGVLP